MFLAIVVVVLIAGVGFAEMFSWAEYKLSTVITYWVCLAISATMIVLLILGIKPPKAILTNFVMDLIKHVIGGE